MLLWSCTCVWIDEAKSLVNRRALVLSRQPRLQPGIYSGRTMDQQQKRSQLPLCIDIWQWEHPAGLATGGSHILCWMHWGEVFTSLSYKNTLHDSQQLSQCLPLFLTATFWSQQKEIRVDCWWFWYVLVVQVCTTQCCPGVEFHKVFWKKLWCLLTHKSTHHIQSFCYKQATPCDRVNYSSSFWHRVIESHGAIAHSKYPQRFSHYQVDQEVEHSPPLTEYPLSADVVFPITEVMEHCVETDDPAASKADCLQVDLELDLLVTVLVVLRETCLWLKEKQMHKPVPCCLSKLLVYDIFKF